MRLGLMAWILYSLVLTLFCKWLSSSEFLKSFLFLLGGEFIPFLFIGWSWHRRFKKPKLKYEDEDDELLALGYVFTSFIADLVYILPLGIANTLFIAFFQIFPLFSMRYHGGGGTERSSRGFYCEGCGTYSESGPNCH